MKRNEFTPEQKMWIDALRSGEYEQCSDYLRDGDAYCCLGVATKLVAPYSKALQRVDGVSIGHNTLPGAERGDQDAPPVTVKRLLMRHSGSSLAEMNDSGKTFDEIADYIEKDPWRVFKNFDEPAREEL